MQPHVEIFSQGEEVITGQTVDSNAAWLAQELVQMGFIVKRHTVVGDNLSDLKKLLKEISLRTDCCICTGGLGPTIDDLTAEAVAQAFDRSLSLDLVALEQIRAYFSARKRLMADTNSKQAFFPLGAERIDNEWGTAPGFALQENRCWFVFLPGVPVEMKAMFAKQIAFRLKQRFSLQANQLVTLRSIGLGESDLQEKINTLSLSESVQLGFRAGADEVQTKLLFPAGADQRQVKNIVQQLVSCIGDYVFAVDGLNERQGGLVSVIDQLMQQQGLTLSVQETASQGLIAAKCIGQPWLLTSSFSQSLQQLSNKLNILFEPDVSFKMAQSIADKIQQQEGADLVLVQLYKGSIEQFQNKDQGIVIYNLLLTPEGIQRSEFNISGPQQRKQNQCALLALDLLRRYLQNKNSSERML
ncbi:MAG: CinA family nicotinamide mononucleotide deamidase-related protein [Methyloprofundus sp.]|nr:CinA family nicotinamide mononucleotide deamidase-related protein [Methyloprofundus sp.]MDT8425406.1 CinA family nicotinamide mononucleotide deamidase-related protein [Methyloprofundus sp.]